MTHMIKIAVTGARGRMGKRIIALAKESTDLEIAGKIDQDDSLDSAIADVDAIIDFSAATVSGKNAQIAAEHGKPIIIGTTGIQPEQEALIKKASEKVAVVYAPNMSIGVNVMWDIVRKATQVLGTDYAIDIEETHHIHKVDRPSGTAKRLIEVMLPGRGSDASDIIDLEDDATWTRKEGEDRISCRSIRRDEVVGDHSVRFSTPYETLEIKHSANTRDVFAQGALTAARWITEKAAGLYGMDDVLGLKTK